VKSEDAKCVELLTELIALAPSGSLEQARLRPEQLRRVRHRRAQLAVRGEHAVEPRTPHSHSINFKPRNLPPLLDFS